MSWEQWNRKKSRFYYFDYHFKTIFIITWQETAELESFMVICDKSKTIRDALLRSHSIKYHYYIAITIVQM